MTQAASEIDRLLRRDPEVEGESREEGRRILVVPPLVVVYRVLAEDRVVRVLDIWRPNTW